MLDRYLPSCDNLLLIVTTSQWKGLLRRRQANEQDLRAENATGVRLNAQKLCHVPRVLRGQYGEIQVDRAKD